VPGTQPGFGRVAERGVAGLRSGARAGGQRVGTGCSADGTGLAGTAAAQRCLCQQEVGMRRVLSPEATAAPGRWHPWVAVGWHGMLGPVPHGGSAKSRRPPPPFTSTLSKRLGRPRRAPGRGGGGGGAEEEPWAAATLPALHPRSHLAPVTSSRQQQPRLRPARPGRDGRGGMGQGGMRAGGFCPQSRADPRVPCGQAQGFTHSSLLLLLAAGARRSQPCGVAPACTAASRVGWLWVRPRMRTVTVVPLGRVWHWETCRHFWVMLSRVGRAAASSSLAWWAPLHPYPQNPPSLQWRDQLPRAHPPLSLWDLAQRSPRPAAFPGRGDVRFAAAASSWAGSSSPGSSSPNTLHLQTLITGFPWE